MNPSPGAAGLPPNREGLMIDFSTCLQEAAVAVGRSHLALLWLGQSSCFTLRLWVLPRLPLAAVRPFEPVQDTCPSSASRQRKVTLP